MSEGNDTFKQAMQAFQNPPDTRCRCCVLSSAGPSGLTFAYPRHSLFPGLPLPHPATARAQAMLRVRGQIVPRLIE